MKQSWAIVALAFGLTGSLRVSAQESQGWQVPAVAAGVGVQTCANFAEDYQNSRNCGCGGVYVGARLDVGG